MKPCENVVIIAGAMGNLGLATAHALQAAGARTVLVDRSQMRLREMFVGLADSAGHFLADFERGVLFHRAAKPGLDSAGSKWI
jgi:NADP-dependent 3-hydroxy acid dehydrogenase YdfG